METRFPTEITGYNTIILLLPAVIVIRKHIQAGIWFTCSLENVLDWLAILTGLVFPLSVCIDIMLIWS